MAGVFHDDLSLEDAKALYDSEWWKECTPEKIVSFQLFTVRLCMPFDLFHEAMEKVLDRPVWTHEFAFAEQLQAEFLKEKPAPSFQEILELIPEEKRVVICVN
jgi:hypothetical protein